MDRSTIQYLNNWLLSKDRKPLVLRGARQVGKTWLVRHFAKISKKKLIELNFEKQPLQASLFDSNDPKQILLNISTQHQEGIDPEQCFLFLDEIQAAPQILAKLRWFAEELPEMPVIAAGSLLEFLLAEHAFSMPVGRISYMHLEPLSFEEFLLANEKKTLYEYIKSYELNTKIPLAIHEQLTKLFEEYMLVGGLPAAVLSWVTEHSFQRMSQIQYDLTATYRDDFAKYKGRLALERLDEVMLAVPKMLGEKFVYSRVNDSIQSATMKQVLALLEKARICHRVSASAANGVPLAAEVKEKYFKEIFLDTGLCSVSLGLNSLYMNPLNKIRLTNNGGMAEQVVGQILRTINPPYMEPKLYYWLREEKGSNAEIDYLIQYGDKIVPIEVKAGSTGSLKSLHLFMELKQLAMAIRINREPPSKTLVHFKDKRGQYQILSLPFYLTGQIMQFLSNECI